jgi:hypothetical protein
MKITDIAAWWGAFIATSLLLWDVYKWKRSGPIISVSASPNMHSYGRVSNALEEKAFITVEATNTGDRKTTLTHLVVFHYTSIFQKLRMKHDTAMFVPNPRFSQPMPYVLEAGERWLGGIEQNDELEEMSRNGYLFCGVYHSSRKKAVLQRVIINKADPT